MNPINTTAGSIRRLTTGPSAGKWQATVVLGEGRGAKRQTRTFGLERDAKQWLHSTKKTGLPTGDMSAITVANAFDAYIAAKVLTPTTVKTFSAAKRYAVEQGIGAVKLANLRPSHVDMYTAHLVRAGLAPRTVNLKAAKLNAVLCFAAADGGLAFTPKAVKVRVTEVKRQAISAADVKALFEAASEDFAPAIILGAYCGLRASEAAGLIVGDINFKTGEVSITRAANDAGEYVRTKTPRSVRVIPVPLDVLAQLRPYCAGRAADAPVALNAWGGVLSSPSFSRTFAAVAEFAGVNITFHALRKFFASTLLAKGVNPVAVAEFLGDTVETMLKTYALRQSTDADAAREAIASALQAAVAA